MIDVSIYKKSDDFTRITTNGHALFSESGKDIVCSAVSALVINTINSLDSFTTSDITVESDESDGFIDCIIENACHDSNLLMKSLVLGLEEIQKSYSRDYLEINIKEV